MQSRKITGISKFIVHILTIFIQINKEVIFQIPEFNQSTLIKI